MRRRWGDPGLISVRSEPRKWHRLAQARSVLTSFVSDLPAKAIFLKSREFRETVEAQIRQNSYDLIVVNGSDLLWTCDFLPASIPRILVAHNMEHLLPVRKASSEHVSSAARPSAQGLPAVTGIRVGGNAADRNVIFLSTEEAAYASGFCPDLRSAVMPPLFDYDARPRPRKKTGSALEIGYVGNFGWWPNQLGLRWFTTEVLPHVTAPIRVNLFGRSSGWPGRPARGGTGHRRKHRGNLCEVRPLDLPIARGWRCLREAGGSRVQRHAVVAHTHAGRGLGLCEDPALVFLDEAGRVD